MEAIDIEYMVDDVLINILKESNLRPLEEFTYWTSVKPKGVYPVFKREQLSLEDIKNTVEEKYPIKVTKSDSKIIEEDINCFLNFTEDDIWKFKDLCIRLFSKYLENDIEILKIYIEIIILQANYYKLLADTYNAENAIYKTKKRMNDKNKSRNSIKSYEEAINRILDLLDSNIEAYIEKDATLKAELRNLKINLPNYLDKKQPIEPSEKSFMIQIKCRIRDSVKIKAKETQRVQKLIKSLITKEKLKYIESYLSGFINK